MRGLGRTLEEVKNGEDLENNWVPRSKRKERFKDESEIFKCRQLGKRQKGKLGMRTILAGM